MTHFILALVLVVPQVQASRGAPVSVPVPAVKSVSFGSSTATSGVAGVRGGSVTGGQEAVLRVELTGPAPCVERCGSVAMNGKQSGHMPVELTTTNSAQVSIQRVLVNTGETVGEGKFVTTPVTANTNVVITAQSAGSPAQRATLTILPPALLSFTLDKTSVEAGEAITATATFTGPPASASAVRLSMQTTNSTVVPVPATVALPMGVLTLTFPLRASGLEQDLSASLVASYLDKMIPATVAVRAAKLWKLSSSSVHIDAIAPPKGAVVTLLSANPARVIVPASVTVAPGDTQASFSVQRIPGQSSADVRVTASYRGDTKYETIEAPKIFKPDLRFVGIAITDHLGNAITAAADGQPIKVCPNIVADQLDGDTRRASNIPIPNSVFRFTYKTPTGTGTSTGRDVDFPLSFPNPFAYTMLTYCVQLPGLAPGGEHDVKLVLDVNNEVDEPGEDIPAPYTPTGNNKKEFKIKRAATP